MNRSLLLFAVLLACAPVNAAESTSDTTTVEAGPFRVTVELEGVFESRAMTEIILRPEEWKQTVVEEIVPHGTRVRRGQVVLQLETDDISEAIRDLEAEIQVAELALKQSELELSAQEPLLPLDLEAAVRSQRIAAEDLDRFNKLERELAVRSAAESLKRARQSLEMEEAELRELEKMYKADDLTEETEEIILKRQRDAVDSARFQLELAEIAHEKTLKITLPRQAETLEAAAARERIVGDKARSELPAAVAKLKLDIQKLKTGLAKSTERLTALRKDLASLTVKSPVDGIVYYGPCVLGNWSSSTDLAAKLRRGSLANANEVLLTVVDPAALAVRVSVPASKLADVRRGVTGYATWAGQDDCRCDVRVESLSAVPLSRDTFTALLEVAEFPAACGVTPVPGLSCTVRLEAYTTPRALSVPVTAVQTDEFDEREKYVEVAGKDSKRERRKVTTGRKTDKKIEIISGLSAGDKVFTKPEE